MTKKSKITKVKENGKTGSIETGCGIIYITVNEKKEGNKKTYGFFIKPDKKAGGCFSAVMDATSRLAGISLKHDIPMEKIIKHLKGIRCSKPIAKGPLSCFDAIAKYLEDKYVKNKK